MIINQFPYPQWKDENQIQYQKYLIKKKITKLMQERNRLIWSGTSEKHIDIIQKQIEDLEKEYNKLNNK